MVALMLCVAVLVIMLCYTVSRKDSIKLSGPKPWPIVGNVYHILKSPLNNMHKWTKMYKGIFKFYRFTSPVVVVGSYEGIQEVLVKRGKEFAGQPLQGSQLTLLGSGSYWEPDQRWELLRQTARKHAKQFASRLTMLEDTGNAAFEDMLQSFASHKGEPFNPRVYVTQAVIDSTALVLIGRKGSVSEELYHQFIEVTTLGVDILTILGSLNEISKYRLFMLFNNRLRRSGLQLRQRIQALLRLTKTEFSGNDKARGDTSMFKAMYELGANGMVDEKMVETSVIALIFGSSASTLPSVMVFINHLTHYKHFSAKLQEEVDRVIGNRPPSVKDKPYMPYMRATIFELIRSLSRFMPHHFAIQDTSIGGVKIPRGTEVFINLWTLFNDETFWSQPFEFKPERFLDPSGNLLPPDHDVRKRLLAFGAGVTGCVGEVMAMDRFFLLMTSLVQRFEVEQVEPKVYCDPRDHPHALIYPPADFQVKMIPRCNKKMTTQGK